MFTEAEKAFWILANGKPDYAWIFERNGDIVYRRPFAAPGSKLPPWISTEREEVTDKIVGKQADLIILDEINTMTKEEQRFETENNQVHPFENEKARVWIKDMLRAGPGTVTFLKKNGEERKMLCTLDEKLIPVEHLPKPLAEGAEPRKRSEESLSVWDLNANGWRSFIYKNVLNCSFTIGDDQSDRVEGYESPPKFD